MKKLLFITAILFSATALANNATENSDILHETMAKSEAQKPETLHRIRDTIQVGKNVAATQEGQDSPSVKAISSLSDFFEKRVKASNHNK